MLTSNFLTLLFFALHVIAAPNPNTQADATRIAIAQSAQTATTAFPCYNAADPDQGIGNYCACTNGATTATIPATGTNTGTNYNPCPYTTAPPLPPPTTARIFTNTTYPDTTRTSKATTTITIPQSPNTTPTPSQNTTTNSQCQNTTLTLTTSYSNLPCYNYAAPDQGIGDFCMCSNGISTPIADTTGNNTGTLWKPCPWTVAPTVQVSSVWTPGAASSTGVRSG